jgi:hypothetical protein
MTAAIARLLMQKITTAMGGKSRRMPMIEALGRKATQEAAAGDLNTLMKLSKLALSFDLASPLEPTAEELKEQERWRAFEVVAFTDWLDLRAFMMAAGALRMDELNRPVLTEGAMDRLFSPGFDPAERDRLIKEYRRSVSSRREPDPFDWTSLTPLDSRTID